MLELNCFKIKGRYYDRISQKYIFSKLAELFQQCLRDYGHGCLSAFLPQMNTGVSVGLLQSFMREESSVRLTPEQQFFT